MKLTMISCITALSIIIAIQGCGGGSEIAEEPFPERIELNISDSIGIETGDSSYIFGSIIDVCHGPSGEILVLDQILCAVRAYDSEGNFISLIGGMGDGPGELRMPLCITCLADDRIFVNDPMKNSFITYDTTYTYIENITDWSNGPPMDPCGLDGSNYTGIQLGFDFESDDGQPVMIRTLGRFSNSIEPDIIYYEDRVTLDLTDFTSIFSNMLFAFALTGDDQGHFFYSPMSSEKYEIHAFDSSGNEIFLISQNIPMAEKTRSEMDEEKIYMESWATRIGTQGVIIDWQSDLYRTMIKSLGVDNLGQLWVQRGTELAPVFDVYDMTGQHLFSAQLPRESSSWKFHIDRYGILGWEEDPESGFQKLYMIAYPEG